MRPRGNQTQKGQNPAPKHKPKTNKNPTNKGLIQSFDLYMEKRVRLALAQICSDLEFSHRLRSSAACSCWLTVHCRLRTDQPVRKRRPPACSRGSPTFFPRVRTPCGHGAQVIIEGREIQSDGGEKDKDTPKTNQTQPTAAHRPRLHHQVVFPLYEGETSETKNC